MDLPPVAPPVPLTSARSAESVDQAARATAEEFEAVFLSEMLKHRGLNAVPDGFGGGAGETAFTSLLTDEYARLLAERGGIGIAEQIYNALKQK